MAIEIVCTHCNRKLRVQDQSLGKKVRCPACKEVFVAADAPLVELADPPSTAVTAPPPPQPAPHADPAIVVPNRLRPPPVPGEPVPHRSRGEGGRVVEIQRVQFKAILKKDPARTLKGMFQAELTDEGLRLRQGKKVDLLLPVGTAAHHVKGPRFAVDVDGRDVELQVFKFGAYQTRLATDTADFLSGRIPRLHREGYTLEWYLFVPAVLPLGIPIITLGGALPCALGFGLAAGCMGIAQIDSLPKGARIGISIALVVVGYLLIFLLLWIVLSGRLR